MADSGVPQEQLLELLVQMKTLLEASNGSPEGVKQVQSIINTHPQLAYGLIKTMVSLDIVDPQAFERTLAANLAQQQAARAAQPIPQVTPAAAPYAQSGGAPPQSNPRPTRFGAPMQAPTAQPPAPYGVSQGTPTYSSDPRRAGQPAQQAPYGAPAPGPALPRNLPPEQEALIQQVLAMTPAQIAALPPEQRDMLLQVRQSVLGSR